MLSDQIREETILPRQNLEKQLIEKIKSLKNTVDYLHLLRLYFGYYHVLEDRIAQAIDPDLLPDYKHRMKSALILADISTFQLQAPHHVPASLDLPEISDHLQAVGAIYALETATHGGKIISRLISEKLGLDKKRGLSFFEGYGKDTWRWWDALTKSIDVLPRNSIQSKRVMDAVSETFLKFSTWIEKYESEM